MWEEEAVVDNIRLTALLVTLIMFERNQFCQADQESPCYRQFVEVFAKCKHNRP